MNYGYYNYYNSPLLNYTNVFAALGVAAVLAVILGIVLFFTFLKKNNEGKFSGVKGKIYNALTFNRFYAENIIKFLYVIAACVITAVGIVYIVLGTFISGICIIMIGNVVLRVSVELLLMFIILCRKTVSVDRRLSKIEAFYGDQYGEDWGDCSGDCQEDCQGDCSGCAEANECCAECGETEAAEPETAEETEN